MPNSKRRRKSTRSARDNAGDDALAPDSGAAPLDDSWSPDYENQQVKIPVLQADGKSRGSLFKDGPWYDKRWIGARKPSLQEVMVCAGSLHSGPWFLIEYVLPRQITGEAARDSLFDEASSCCRRTPVQALFWFTQQAFGPPPDLVARVREFAADWSHFRDSASAIALLQSVIARGFVPSNDRLSNAQTAEDLGLLRRLELIHVSNPGPEEDFFADSVVEDMGVTGYIAWMSGHLDRVARWTSSVSPEHGAQELSEPTYYDLAVATIVGAKSISLFWRHRAGHPAWKAIWAQVPQHMRDAVDEYHTAQQDVSLARHEHSQAMGGTFYGNWIDAAQRDRKETVRALAQRLEQAEARLARATSNVNSTEHERSLAENAAVERWLRGEVAALQKTRDAFAVALQEHLHTVETLKLEPFVLGEWKGTAASTVLRDIADHLIRHLGAGPSRDGLRAVPLIQQAVNLSDEAWRDLELAVRKEAAAVMRRRGDPVLAPAGSGTLKFPRPAEARQKCLEALGSAPNGIPTHQDIANTTGLEHQTIKEAMPKLKKAGHVEKRDATWFITESGRAHLKVLRGE